MQNTYRMTRGTLEVSRCILLNIVVYISDMISLLINLIFAPQSGVLIALWLQGKYIYESKSCRARASHDPKSIT
jgi:hypothetical protein